MRFTTSTHLGTARPKTDPEADSKTDHEADPEAGTEARRTSPDSETDPEHDPEADPEADPVDHPEANPVNDPETDPETVKKPILKKFTDGILVEDYSATLARPAAEKTNGGEEPEAHDAEYLVMGLRECRATRPDGSTFMIASALEPQPWHLTEHLHRLVMRHLRASWTSQNNYFPDDVYSTTSTARSDSHEQSHRRLMAELVTARPRHDERDSVRWCPHLGRAVEARHEAALALRNEHVGLMHRELLDIRPHAGVTAYIRRKRIRWRAQINDTRRLLLSELRMLVCGPDEALEAKDDHFWALRRLPAHAVAAIQALAAAARIEPAAALPHAVPPRLARRRRRAWRRGRGWTEPRRAGGDGRAERDWAKPRGAGGDGRAQRGGVTVEAASPTPAARTTPRPPHDGRGRGGQHLRLPELPALSARCAGT